MTAVRNMDRNHPEYHTEGTVTTRLLALTLSVFFLGELAKPAAADAVEYDDAVVMHAGAALAKQDGVVERDVRYVERLLPLR